MNSQTKSAIKQLVLDLRHTLEDELAIALRRYGLETDRKWSCDAPPERLTDPRDREIWVHCGVGQRSYYAARILRQHGFAVRNLSGGMRSFQATRRG